MVKKFHSIKALNLYQYIKTQFIIFKVIKTSENMFAAGLDVAGGRESIFRVRSGSPAALCGRGVGGLVVCDPPSGLEDPGSTPGRCIFSQKSQIFQKLQKC